MSLVLACRGQNHYDNFLSKGYAQTAISTTVSSLQSSSRPQEITVQEPFPVQSRVDKQMVMK